MTVTKTINQYKYLKKRMLMSITHPCRGYHACQTGLLVETCRHLGHQLALWTKIQIKQGNFFLQVIIQANCRVSRFLFCWPITS